MECSQQENETGPVPGLLRHPHPFGEVITAEEALQELIGLIDGIPPVVQDVHGLGHSLHKASDRSQSALANLSRMALRTSASTNL